jgi:hypothetical protein
LRPRRERWVEDSRQVRQDAKNAKGDLGRAFGEVAVELRPGDLAEIVFAASKIAVQGARYPEKLEMMTGR